MFHRIPSSHVVSLFLFLRSPIGSGCCWCCRCSCLLTLLLIFFFSFRHYDDHYYYCFMWFVCDWFIRSFYACVSRVCVCVNRHSTVHWICRCGWYEQYGNVKSPSPTIVVRFIFTTNTYLIRGRPSLLPLHIHKYSTTPQCIIRLAAFIHSQWPSRLQLLFIHESHCFKFTFILYYSDECLY